MTAEEELIEATLIIGAKRANPDLIYDTAMPLIKKHIKSLAKRHKELMDKYAKQEKIKLLEKINKEKYNVKLIINQELKNLKDE